MGRRSGLRAVAACLLVAALGAVAAVSRPDGDHAKRALDPLRAAARDVADAWPALQTRRGWYRDYVYGHGRGFCEQKLCRKRLGNARYGESLLGYGLVMTGLRERDDRLVDSGLRAIGYVVAKLELQARLPTAFEGLAVAATYNLMRARDPDNARFARSRRSWEAWLRRQPPTTTIYFDPSTRRFSNHYLVEAIEVLELLRTGLRSRDPRAILGPRRSRFRRVTGELLTRRVPEMAARYAVGARGRRAWLLSDPPDNPLAYYGLTIGLYARALRLAGTPSRRAGRALRTAANASLWLTAPDGDMAYFGRSQEQSWAYAGLVLGDTAAAGLGGARSREAWRLRTVVDRLVARLRAGYGSGPQGWWIVPALREGRRPLRGLDRYTGAVAFSGLTLVNLEWAIEERGRQRPGVRRRAPEPVGAVALSRGESRFGVVRTPDVWFAVKRQPATKRAGDLRYDFGLSALKVRARGRWRTVLRPRPKTSGQPDSAGPILHKRGTIGFPRGKRLEARGRAIVVEGLYRTPSRKGLRRDVRWVYRPIRCGVRLTYPGRAGDVYEYSVFVRPDAGRPRLRGRTLIAGSSRTVFPVRPAAVQLSRGYASAVDPSLVRARVELAAPRTGDLSIDTCQR